MKINYAPFSIILNLLLIDFFFSNKMSLQIAGENVHCCYILIALHILIWNVQSNYATHSAGCQNWLMYGIYMYSCKKY